MKDFIRPKFKWDYETCKEYALKCNNRVEFSKRYSGGYNSASRNLWLDDICSHMTQYNIKWTYELFIKEASKYNNVNGLRNGCMKAYDAGRYHNWVTGYYKTDKNI